MRRPAAPRLRSGPPGAPTQVTPEVPATLAPTGSVPRTRRRAVLLVGAIAAVCGTAGVGALLRGGGSAAPSAASGDGAAPGGGSAPGRFADVATDHPGAEAMRWADETGVQPALTTTGYSPQTAVDRGDLAVALHRLAGAPAVDLGSLPVPFTDLGDDPARLTALLWLHARGALWGDAALRVHPQEPATRDCAAMMLAALMRPALAGVGVTWDASTDASLPPAEGPDSALADVAWLEAAGMAPAAIPERSGDATVTRADLALSLHRANAVITDALG